MPYPPTPNDPNDDDDDDTTTANGELRSWWNRWILDYDVILLGTEAAPKLKLRAWKLLSIPVVLAFVIGLVLG